MPLVFTFTFLVQFYYTVSVTSIIRHWKPKNVLTKKHHCIITAALSRISPPCHSSRRITSWD